MKTATKPIGCSVTLPQPLPAYAVVNGAGHISHIELSPEECKSAACRGFQNGGSGQWPHVADVLGLEIIPVTVTPVMVNLEGAAR